MSPATEATIRLDVAAYVEEVRRCLVDLSADERDELTGGLEADLTERLQETPVDGDLHAAFGDPRQYADELRAAAGLESRPAGRRLLWTLPDADHLRKWWERRSSEPGAERALAFLTSLRPVWWVLRAWIAVQTLDYWFGSWPHDWVPGFHGSAGGVLLLLAAIVVSVQLGRGKWWPATVPTGWTRWLLVAANAFAVAMIPAVLSQLPTSSDIQFAATSYHRAAPPGLWLNGHQVRNIYAYDVNGKPLVGVQLFDQGGKPVTVRAVATWLGRRRWQPQDKYIVTYPWGWQARSQRAFNVYPMATREQRAPHRLADAFSGASSPTVAPPPFIQAPAVAPLPDSTLEQFYDATGTTPQSDSNRSAKRDKHNSAASPGNGKHRRSRNDSTKRQFRGSAAHGHRQRPNDR